MPRVKLRGGSSGHSRLSGRGRGAFPRMIPPRHIQKPKASAVKRPIKQPWNTTNRQLSQICLKIITCNFIGEQQRTGPMTVVRLMI